MDNNEENLFGTTLSHEPVKKGLKDRISDALRKTEKKVQEIRGKVFTYLKIRTFKDYSYSDMIDEGYIFMKYKQQEKRIKEMEDGVKELKKRGADPDSIKEVEYELARARAKYEAIKSTMRGTKGFDFLGPESKPVISNEPLYTSSIKSLGDKSFEFDEDGKPVVTEITTEESIYPQVQESIQMRQLREEFEKSRKISEEQRKNTFRTRYSKIVKSERKHCASAVASTLICGATAIVIIYALQEMYPDVFTVFGGNPANFDKIIPMITDIVRQGIEKIKNINDVSQIAELITGAPTRILISATLCGGALMRGMHEKTVLDWDKDYRKSLEEENFKQSILEDNNRGRRL